MKISIEIEGDNDLQDLVDSVNAEKDLDLQASYIREQLTYYWDGEIKRIYITIVKH